MTSLLPVLVFVGACLMWWASYNGWPEDWFAGRARARRAQRELDAYRAAWDEPLRDDETPAQWAARVRGEA